MTKSEIPEALLNTAAKLFLEKDYHSVSIREIAELSNTTSAMINYYFGSKYQLFEEAIKQEYQKILNVLDEVMNQEEILDFTVITRNVLNIYNENPNISKFIIKTILLRQGPGSDFVKKSFESERAIIKKWVARVIKEGLVDEKVNSEVARIAFMSLTLLPSLMRESLIESYGKDKHTEFLDEFSDFAGEIMQHGLRPKKKK